MPRTRMVSDLLLSAAARHVEAIFSEDPTMREAWFQLNQSCAANDIVALGTDFDWVVGALMMLSGGTAKIPRDASVVETSQ